MNGIKVFAPATISNLACGFDTLGLALEAPGDEVIISPSNKPGIQIVKITGDQGRLPLDTDKNAAGVAALNTLKFAIEEGIIESHAGFQLELRKKMPYGSGLGSSGASAVAGAMAVNQYLKHPLEKRQLLTFAMQGETAASGSTCADNVAASMLGGIILVRDNATLDVHRLPVPRGMYVAVVHPHFEILTKDSRAALSPSAPLKDAVSQWGNMGGLVVGLYNADFDLIRRSLQDHVIEHQRAHMIPGFYEVQKAALEMGALGCSISGSGPSVFAICNSSLVAENAAEAMKAAFLLNKIECDVFLSAINQEGAERM